MVGWIILGVLGFLALLLILLFTVHAHLIIDLKDDAAITVKVLGIPIHLHPKKTKKYKFRHYTLKKIRRREAKAAKASQKKAAKAAEKKRKKADDARLTKAEKKAAKKRKKAARPAITDMIPLVGRTVKRFSSHFFGKLHIQLAHIHVRVGGGDAAAVALSYALITNAMGLLVKALQKFCDVDSPDKADISVEPDFLSDTVTYDAHIVFRLTLGNVVWAAIKAGWHFLLGYTKIKPDVPDGDAHHHDDTHRNGDTHRNSDGGRNGDPTHTPPDGPRDILGVPLPPTPPTPLRPW